MVLTIFKWNRTKWCVTAKQLMFILNLIFKRVCKEINILHFNILGNKYGYSTGIASITKPREDLGFRNSLETLFLVIPGF